MTGRNTPVLAALKTQHRQGGMHGKDLRGGRNHMKLAAMAATTAVIIRDPGWPITSFHRRVPISFNTHTIQWIGIRGETRRSNGPAPFEKKPIHLSVGYAACHWCHVMAHESFEDAETARVLNERFINIKVDREERPDVDRIYQIAQQMLTQRSGGWPLTMFR